MSRRNDLPGALPKDPDAVSGQGVAGDGDERRQVAVFLAPPESARLVKACNMDQDGPILWRRQEPKLTVKLGVGYGSPEDAIQGQLDPHLHFRLDKYHVAPPRDLCWVPAIVGLALRGIEAGEGPGRETWTDGGLGPVRDAGARRDGVGTGGRGCPPQGILAPPGKASRARSRRSFRILPESSRAAGGTLPVPGHAGDTLPRRGPGVGGRHGEWEPQAPAFAGQEMGDCTTLSSGAARQTSAIVVGAAPRVGPWGHRSHHLGAAFAFIRRPHRRSGVRPVVLALTFPVAESPAPILPVTEEIRLIVNRALQFALDERKAARGSIPSLYGSLSRRPSSSSRPTSTADAPSGGRRPATGTCRQPLPSVGYRHDRARPLPLPAAAGKLY